MAFIGKNYTHLSYILTVSVVLANTVMKSCAFYSNKVSDKVSTETVPREYHDYSMKDKQIIA